MWKRVKDLYHIDPGSLIMHDLGVGLRSKIEASWKDEIEKQAGG